MCVRDLPRAGALGHPAWVGGQKMWSAPEAFGRKKSQNQGTCAAGKGPKAEPAPRRGQMITIYRGKKNLFTSRRSLGSKPKKELKTVMVKHSYLFSLINSLQFLVEKKNQKTLGFKYSAPSHTTICIHYLQLSNKHGVDFQTFNLLLFNQKLFSFKTEISISDYELEAVLAQLAHSKGSLLAFYTLHCFFSHVFSGFWRRSKG